MYHPETFFNHIVNYVTHNGADRIIVRSTPEQRAVHVADVVVCAKDNSVEPLEMINVPLANHVTDMFLKQITYTIPKVREFV